VSDVPEMVLRVARAINPDAFYPYERFGVGGEMVRAIPVTDEHRRWQSQAIEDAKSAIEAMYEPTDAMMASAWKGSPLLEFK
jgi:hypothetical protein